MKVTSSRPYKIQMVEEDNERRQEKCAWMWRCLDVGDPAAVPCLCKQGEAACLKHPQRKTFAAVIKWCTANPLGWLRSGSALAIVLFSVTHSLIVNKSPAGRWVLRTFNFYLKQNQVMPPWADNSIQAKWQEWLTPVLPIPIPTSFTCSALPLPAPFNCSRHEGNIYILADTYFWRHLKDKRQSKGKCATTLLALPTMPPLLSPACPRHYDPLLHERDQSSV